MSRKLFFDFGDRATGRVVNPNDFRAVSPPRFAAGVVTTIYPAAPNVVGITYSNGETCTIRVQS